MQEWKDIPGFEGLYQASPQGDIKSIPRKSAQAGKVLKPQPNGSGYFWVCLRKDGKSHSIYIHRLIALTFLDTYIAGLEVNHKDGIKSNNDVSNLEWCTSSENKSHRHKVLKQPGANTGKAGALSWKSKPVNMLDETGNVIRTYPGVMEAARQIGMNEAGIRSVIYGKSKTCKGYKWEYA